MVVVYGYKSLTTVSRMRNITAHANCDDSAATSVGFDLNADRLTTPGLDRGFAAVFERGGSAGAAIQQNGTDHDAARFRRKHEIDVPLEQPGPVR
ncbi:MAG: hypothetical protein ACK57O_03620, partial [Planctomyces sp.]